MDSCIFCKIIEGDIPSDRVCEDDDVYAFHDINPCAPTHILIVPKKHIEKVSDIDGVADTLLMGKLVAMAKTIAAELSLTDGYRLVFNNGPQGGQEVQHIHLHLMGGRQMAWPPG